MNYVIVFILVGIIYFALERRIKKVEEKVMDDSIAPFSHKLHFDLHHAIVLNPIILNRADVTKEEIGVGYDKWPKAFEKKWYGFLQDENSHLGAEHTNFNATYLASDNMFIIEGNSQTYVIQNRTPSNNTRLYDQTLRYYPNKDKDLRNEELRLEVDLRSEESKGQTICLISVGIREFENKTLAKSKYTKILDFPFSYPYTKGNVSDEVLKEYDFEVKRQTPWYDKDEFGKVTAHPWDTAIEYKHKSEATISWLT